MLNNDQCTKWSYSPAIPFLKSFFNPLDVNFEEQAISGDFRLIARYVKEANPALLNIVEAKFASSAVHLPSFFSEYKSLDDHSLQLIRDRIKHGYIFTSERGSP